MIHARTNSIEAKGKPFPMAYNAMTRRIPTSKAAGEYEYRQHNDARGEGIGAGVALGVCRNMEEPKPWRGKTAMQWNRWRRRACSVALAVLAGIATVVAQATVCARVKIDIKQALTLERPAFGAKIKLTKTTATGDIE